jgi:hypothetical protein
LKTIHPFCRTLRTPPFASIFFLPRSLLASLCQRLRDDVQQVIGGVGFRQDRGHAGLCDFREVGRGGISGCGDDREARIETLCGFSVAEIALRLFTSEARCTSASGGRAPNCVTPALTCRRRRSKH